MEHSQMTFLVASLATTRDRRFWCCGKAIHLQAFSFTRTWAGRSWGAEAQPGSGEGLTPTRPATKEPAASQTRAGSSQSAILCDRRGGSGPQPPGGQPDLCGLLVFSPPCPPLRSLAQSQGPQRGRCEAAKAQGNEGWRREAGGEHRRIPLRNKADRYRLRPGRFKSLSMEPAPLPSVGRGGCRAAEGLHWEGAPCPRSPGGAPSPLGDVGTQATGAPPESGRTFTSQCRTWPRICPRGLSLPCHR